MWALYRKTFWRMQIAIWFVTAFVFFVTHGNYWAAGGILAVMQWSAIIGAVWGVRLRSWMSSDNSLPLKAR